MPGRPKESVTPSVGHLTKRRMSSRREPVALWADKILAPDIPSGVLAAGAQPGPVYGPTCIRPVYPILPTSPSHRACIISRSLRSTTRFASPVPHAHCTTHQCSPQSHLGRQPGLQATGSGSLLYPVVDSEFHPRCRSLQSDICSSRRHGTPGSSTQRQVLTLWCGSGDRYMERRTAESHHPKSMLDDGEVAPSSLTQWGTGDDVCLTLSLRRPTASPRSIAAYT